MLGSKFGKNVKFERRRKKKKIKRKEKSEKRKGKIMREITRASSRS